MGALRTIEDLEKDNKNMHQYLDKLMCKSNYHVKNVESDIQGEKLLKALLHLNACN